MKKAASKVFPKVLFSILEDAASMDFENIISWHKNGKYFKIHDRQAFIDAICPRYGINLSSYKSFSRQLNLWGFACCHGGRTNPDRGHYYHSSFLRDSPDTLNAIIRTEIKGKKKKQTIANNLSKPDSEASAGNLLLQGKEKDFAQRGQQQVSHQKACEVLPTESYPTHSREDGNFVLYSTNHCEDAIAMQHGQTIMEQQHASPRRQFADDYYQQSYEECSEHRSSRLARSQSVTNIIDLLKDIEPQQVHDPAVTAPFDTPSGRKENESKMDALPMMAMHIFPH